MYPGSSTTSGSLEDGRMEAETVACATMGTDPDRLEVQLESEEFQRIKEEMSRATAVTVTQRRACPVHESPGEPKTSQRNWIKYLLTALQLFLVLALDFFPPWPHRIVRKLLYRAPPRGQSYHLLYGEGKDSKVSFCARECVDKPNVRLCLPQLLTNRLDGVNVFYQLSGCQTFILNIQEENIHICAVHIRCCMSHLLNLAGHARPSPFLIIFCQPNSSDLGDWLVIKPNLADMTGFWCDMLLFDYPGYGVSDGQPCEYMILKSAERVMEHARSGLGYRDEQIILMGFSLGTAAAVHLASITPSVGALVLLAPFTSLLRVCFNLPRLERSWPFDSFRSIDRASAVECPTLVCHGTKDLIVRQAHGRAMAEEIEGVEFWLVEPATHLTLLGERVLWDIHKYLDRKLGIMDEWIRTARHHREE